MWSGTETIPSTAMVFKGYKAHPSSLKMSKARSSYVTSEKKKMKGAEEGCTHCGNPKYTQETYFKLHGYLEW